MSKAAGGPGLSTDGITWEKNVVNCFVQVAMANLILLKRRDSLTQDVHFHHRGGPAADIHGFYDVCARIASLTVCDCHCGFPRNVFDGDSLVWLQKGICLCPGYFRFRLSSHSGRKLNLGACFYRKASKEFHIKEDLRSL